MIQNVDVAIIGGGMVGMTLALALKESGLRIAIVEAGKLEVAPHVDIDTRVSALSRSSENILRNLGAWQGIESARATGYHAMEVWEQDSFARIDFDAASVSAASLGHIVENRVITQSLLHQIQASSQIALHTQTCCQSLNIGESEAWLTLDNGQALTAKLVVGADGARSWVRKQSDIPLTHWDYGHTAIVANVRTELAHDGIARQVFTPQGPLAFLPLHQDNLCSIVWSTDPDRADELMAMPEEEFLKALTTSFDAKLGLCQLESPRQAFPLTMRYARDFAVERIALVGDAAHTIHPLAGQGVNLGLLDAACLAQEIEQMVEAGKDFGKKHSLRGYERWRKAEAAKMIAAMQGFRDLFSGTHPAKKLFRGVGMSLVGQLPMVKQQIMYRALGLKGELPELASRVSE